ncbi:DUF4345 domain-containing protein [Phyllobacterium salinisoli]|uniref:DUF4345 domain-containing protein n=1 Tax=Phyllobacterium salinisoli TaxID=1899321 RepID=A0A368K5I4_9HYPH|nr:DUF4345 family protein [Phyllobacterium salinisoli]RCS23632.1 DUF4345 domain-containing protein [Phyllobacterium salinisoli]
MEFYWPASDGEWFAWISAAITVLFGAILFFAPGLSMKLLRLAPVNERPEAFASVRATMAGFHIGLGLSCLMFAQPFLWLALGAAWGFTLFGRLISIMSDRGNTFYNWMAVVLEFLLAAAPLLFAFGFVS